MSMWILKTLLRLPGSVVIELDGQAAGLLLRVSAYSTCGRQSKLRSPALPSSIAGRDLTFAASMGALPNFTSEMVNPNISRRAELMKQGTTANPNVTGAAPLKLTQSSCPRFQDTSACAEPTRSAIPSTAIFTA